MAGIKGVSGKAGSANILEAGERRYFGKGSSIGLMTGLAAHGGPRAFCVRPKQRSPIGYYNSRIVLQKQIQNPSQAI